MADLQKGSTFTDGVSIANAANLNNLVDLGTILPGFIADKTNNTSPSTGCELVINDAGTLKKVTIANLATVITGGASGVVHGKTAITALTTLDEFLVWEDTAAGERKITYTDLVTALEADINYTHLNGLPTMYTGTRTFDPSSLASLSNRAETMTVTGVTTANTPSVFMSCGLDTLGLGIELVNPRVSANDTVQFYLYNFTGGSVNLPSITVRATVFQY
jgi:hypothetical protein